MNQIIINKEIVACPRPRVTKYGVFYPKKYQDFKDFLYNNFINNNIKHIQEGAIRLELEFYVKIPSSYSKKLKEELHLKYITKRPDIDNYIKSIMDGLNSFAWEDDSQVSEISAFKKYTKEEPYIIIKYIEI